MADLSDALIATVERREVALVFRDLVPVEHVRVDAARLERADELRRDVEPRLRRLEDALRDRRQRDRWVVDTARDRTARVDLGGERAAEKTTVRVNCSESPISGRRRTYTTGALVA